MRDSARMLPLTTHEFRERVHRAIRSGIIPPSHEERWMSSYARDARATDRALDRAIDEIHKHRITPPKPGVFIGIDPVVKSMGPPLGINNEVQKAMRAHNHHEQFQELVRMGFAPDKIEHRYSPEKMGVEVSLTGFVPDSLRHAQRPGRQADSPRTGLKFAITSRRARRSTRKVTL